MSGSTPHSSSPFSPMVGMFWRPGVAIGFAVSQGAVREADGKTPTKIGQWNCFAKKVLRGVSIFRFPYRIR